MTMGATLMWCIVMNIAFLLLWWVMFMTAHDWIYRMHGRWFKLSVETFDAIHYSGMLLFKLYILVFNIIPYVVLHITRW